MLVDPSISAVLFAHNHDDQATRYSQTTSPPAHVVMSSYLRRLLSSLTTQGREIQDGVDLISRRQAEQHASEMAELRTREYLQTLMHYDSVLTHTQRSLTD
jgi:predicted component of type VI protein secretion system